MGFMRTLTVTSITTTLGRGIEAISMACVVGAAMLAGIVASLKPADVSQAPPTERPPYSAPDLLGRGANPVRHRLSLAFDS